jgi:hypothetical protein
MSPFTSFYPAVVNFVTRKVKGERFEFLSAKFLSNRKLLALQEVDT